MKADRCRVIVKAFDDDTTTATSFDIPTIESGTDTAIIVVCSFSANISWQDLSPQADQKATKVIIADFGTGRRLIVI